MRDYLADFVDEEDMDPGESIVAPLPDAEGEEGFLEVPELSSLLGGGEEVEEDLASEDEVLSMMDEVYNAFEDIFEVEIPEDARTRMKRNTVYDESPLFNLRNALPSYDFVAPMAVSGTLATAGVIANSWRALEMSDRVLEETGNFAKSTEVFNKALGLNDEIAMTVMGAGALYAFKNSYWDVKNEFTGKYKPDMSPLVESLDLGGRDYKIAITPDRITSESALYTGVSESLHRLQDAVDSPTHHDPLLDEGMDVFAKYLIAEKFEDNDILTDIDHDLKARMIKFDHLIDAYGILKNNGGFMTDERTFIDAGLDPEESLRASKHAKNHVSRDDRTLDQLFGYSVGGAYLIMEYEKGNLDPAEVLREGRDALPENFQEVYNMSFMQNL
ncbi:MAG: hypothetical protein ABEK16_05135 [Candidatus Nanohalobium sp.]